MKPISKLAMYKKATTPIELLRAFLRLTNNPKRHLRGPMYSSAQGNGKPYQAEGSCCDGEQAVSACAMGALNLLVARGHSDAYMTTKSELHITSNILYPYDNGFIDVSDDRGLKAIRRIAKSTLTRLLKAV